MIQIYRGDYDSKLNHFHGKNCVRRDEVILKKMGEYVYAEPAINGTWAFGGTLLFTSNGVFPDFTTPIKLHDRNMALEL